MTKAKPLSTDNTPNDLKLNRQAGDDIIEDRGVPMLTDGPEYPTGAAPKDPNWHKGYDAINEIDPALLDKLTELDRTDPIDAYSSETLDRMDDIVQKLIAEETDPGPTGLDFEAATKLESDEPEMIRWPDEEENRGKALGRVSGAFGHVMAARLEAAGLTAGELRYLADKTARPPVLDPEDATTNPYILESHTVLTDLNRAAVEARRTIAALDREIADLDRTADEQIALINARRGANKAQREKRKEDLMKIVAADAMVNGEPKGTSE